MRFFLPAVLACSAILAASSAQAMDYTDLQISRPGDLAMQCPEISREISLMDDVIVQARETQHSSEVTTTGVGVAKTVASYLVGSLGGALGIMAAGYIVAEATDDRGENAEAIENIAQQRRSFMVGVYNARSCLGPLDFASIEPAAGESEAQWEPNQTTRYHYND